jgi:hypothetical protein
MLKEGAQIRGRLFAAFFAKLADAQMCLNERPN